MLTLAVKLSISAAFIYFMVALVTWIWKYQLMISSPKGRSRYYVDIAHRSSFLYSSAAMLLALLAYFSQLPEWLNNSAVIANLVFFTAAIISYIHQGVLNKTSNQIRSSMEGKDYAAPIGLVHGFMVALIIAEVGGTLVLGYGAMMNIW